MEALRTDIALLIERGGFIMLPLLMLSIVSLALIVERAWFWSFLHRPRRLRRLDQIRDALRKGDIELTSKLAAGDGATYGQVAERLIEHGATDAVAVEAVEAQRPKLERFMVSLSTIITAAPLLGILGTVIGIIRSFALLGGAAEGGLTDPSVVSHGIAEALLTTAMGLVVALVTLFPYMVFKGQVDRALGRIEALIAAAQQGAKLNEEKGKAVRSSGRGTPSRASRPVPAETT